MINTKKLKNIIKYSSFIEIVNSGNVIFATNLKSTIVEEQDVNTNLFSSNKHQIHINAVEKNQTKQMKEGQTVISQHYLAEKKMKPQ